MSHSLSVIIPAHNAERHLNQCLSALMTCSHPPFEIIVVDDGSTDATRQVAERYPVKLLATERCSGPALARNVGAKAASGDILLFLDSDVCVQEDTIELLSRSFEADPELDAVIGSYDSAPRSQDFLSQYRNLMHFYVHQTGAQRASTFWSGCGAIRRDVFLAHSGFDEGFGRPAIEDIELGYRLHRAGRKIVLDRAVQVTHLKRWTFWGLVKTDILDRGIPWTELILRDRMMPNDLNLQLSQRVSVALVFILVALAGLTALRWGGYFLVPLFAVVFALLARWWGEFAASDRPRWAPFALFGVLGVIVALSYFYKMYGLIPPLMLSPALLLARHRYNQEGGKLLLRRLLVLAYTGCSAFAAVYYLPMRGLVFECFMVLAILGLMNSQFYLFLAGNRGIPFMLAAIPFHLLYHFYNGVSFLFGIGLHLTRQRADEPLRTPAHPRS